jgi:hypothetical protein
MDAVGTRRASVSLWCRTDRAALRLGRALLHDNRVVIANHDAPAALRWVSNHRRVRSQASRAEGP